MGFKNDFGTSTSNTIEDGFPDDSMGLQARGALDAELAGPLHFFFFGLGCLISSSRALKSNSL
jgi:hypothetical protein